VATEPWEIAFRNLGFWQKLEVRRAVKRGRRVDDLALAPIAVSYARRVEETNSRRAWSVGIVLMGAIYVTYAVVSAILFAQDSLALGIVFGVVMLPLGLRLTEQEARCRPERIRERAEAAESQNR
jgi:hypothetical protein